jgi:hypothetical protein
MITDAVGLRGMEATVDEATSTAHLHSTCIVPTFEVTLIVNGESLYA